MAPRHEAPAPAQERRSRLRQYQVQLMERMQAARGGARGSAKELGVLLGQRRCLLALTQIGAIVPAAGISPVPLAQDWYLGLVNIRGALSGVVDLARYGGEARYAPGPDNRIITFAPALGLPCALLASRVLGLRAPDQMRAEDEPAGAPPWAARACIDADGQRWTRLDLALLVREARFLHIGC